MIKIIKIILVFFILITTVSLKNNATYKEIIKTGIKPKINPDYPFPVSKQFNNGCFGFAVKNVVKYKYNEDIDLLEAEKKIKKSRKDLWTEKHIKNFLKEYKLKTIWFDKASDFFYFLHKGEPVIIQYKYYTSKNYWIGHFVAVYSFDKTGVWISETIKANRIKIPYEKVFYKDCIHTDFSFAVVKKIK